MQWIPVIVIAIVWPLTGYIGRSLIYSTNVYEGDCDPYPPFVWTLVHIIAGPLTLASGAYIALTSCFRDTRIALGFRTYGILFECTKRALYVEGNIYRHSVNGRSKRK